MDRPKSGPALGTYDIYQTSGAYKFGKMKFPEFSRFSRPSKQSFPDNYKVKT